MNWLLIGQHAGVFVGMTVTDICWAKYTKTLADGNRYKAAFWSGAIVACGAMIVTSYTENHNLIWDAIAGAVVGTFIAAGKKDE